MIKMCSKCNQELPATLEYFYSHAGRKDKLDTSCKVCSRAAKKEWFNNNKEVKAARDKARYEKKKDSILAKNKIYYQNNKDKHREKSRKQKAKRKSVYSEPWKESEVLSIHGTICYLCNSPIDMLAPRQTGKPGWQKGLHMDHVVAQGNNGPDILNNIRPSHGLCNLTKGTKEIYENQTA